MEEVVARAVETPRSTAWLVTGFTILALGLAAAGIYGVVNHTVVRRTRELGVRLALGSGPGRVVALVAGSSFVQVAAGCTVGLVLAWLLGRLVRSLLFGIAPHDMLSFAAAPALLLVVTLAATAVPAFRALRIDPADCLREG
jgi:ABC-type antimicrobial peptide transport system permease subunit